MDHRTSTIHKLALRLYRRHLASKAGKKMRKAYKFTIWFAIGGFLLGTIFLSCQTILDKPSSLLWALAYLFVGGLGGLIFGIPKSVPVTANRGNVDDKPKFQDNNNLMEISDWLTKIIVGAGLVQMKDIPGYIIKIAYRMGLGMRKSNQANIEAATMLSASIIIYFTILGFIIGYLVSRGILLDMFEGSDDETVVTVVDVNSNLIVTT